MKIHPAAEIFPMLSDEELDSLAVDIKTHGLRHPLVMHDRELLDGRNRLAACKIAGVAPSFVEYEGDSPVSFVISVNIKRRQLDPSQRACVAVEIEPMFAVEAKKRQGQRTDIVANLRQCNQAKASDQAAEVVSVSPRMVQYAKEIKAKNPEAFERVKSGEVTVNEVQQEIKREKRVDALKTRQVELAHATPVKTKGIDIRKTDCLDLIASLSDESVHLLLTDPPYAVTENDWDVWASEDEYWKFMRTWLGMLRPKMRADFTAFVFCDADKTTQLHQTLVDTGWPVLRQAIWHRPNLAKKRTGSMTFLSSYEPFWHCGTRHLNLPEEWGEERFDVQKYVVPQSTHKDDQSFHPTQKPLGLMQRLVEIGSYQSELVVDPFCGAGTTALAAYSKDRFCITGDTNADYVAIAKGRISEHKNAK
jgi:DNA modification methylase/ParB-like chromosome segregation protein Spo0J